MRFDLVTGGTGFIGRHLCRRLIGEGRKVKIFCRGSSVGALSCLPRECIEIVCGDLRDRSSIENAVAGAERVFHCAGHVSDWGSREAFHSINVTGTQWLLEAAHRESVKRFVHLSSIAVFGVPSPPFFDDDSPYGPGRDLYSRTKIDGEAAALRHFRERGLPVVVLRPPVVYGPWGTWVEEPVRMIRRNKMFLIGGGKGTCHPCHIDNLTDAMVLAAEHPAAVGRAYIVGDGESISFEEYFNALARIVGAGPIRKSIPLPLARIMASAFETAARFMGSNHRPLLTHTAIHMVTTRSVMRMDRIRKELGFTPRISVAQGMELLRGYFENGGGLSV